MFVDPIRIRFIKGLKYESPETLFGNEFKRVEAVPVNDKYELPESEVLKI
jgi:hypothetical protein